MKSVLIRVDELAKGAYPISLLVDENGGTKFTPVPGAKDRIPASLAVAGAPLDPVNNTPLEVASARAYVDRNTTNATLLERAGILLFKCLARPNIEKAWTPLRKAGSGANGKDVALRTFLDIRPADLAALPWEAMRATQVEMLARNARTPLTRWADTGAHRRNPIPLPLRVLVIIGCEANDAKVKWRDELDAIVEALCPVRHWADVEYFDCRRQHVNGPLDALQQLVPRFSPDVVHFIGHGQAATAVDAAGLLLHDARGFNPQVLWSAAEVAATLNTGDGVPRLAVINACRSADFAGPTGTWSVTQALIDGGVDAVVGMQGDVAGHAASAFARDFYGAIIQQKAIDVAVVAGRGAMAAAGGAGSVDWIYPSLVLQVDPQSALETEAHDSADVLKQVQLHRELTGIRKSFVDRRTERRNVASAARRQLQGLSIANVSLIKGQPDIGKTWLLKCVLEAALLRGFNVAYVDLAAHANTLQRDLSAIDFMRAVRGPQSGANDVLRPSWYKQFARFNDAISALLDNRLPPDDPAAGVDSETEWRQGGGAYPDTIDVASEHFLQALRQVAKKRPLVLALDHLTSEARGISPDQFSNYIFPKIVSPIAAGDVANVFVLIAAPSSDEQIADFGLASLDVHGVAHELGEFPSQEWDLLAREFAALKGLPADKVWETIQFFDKGKVQSKPTWGRRLLDLMEEFVR